jgi:hypothetical protein
MQAGPCVRSNQLDYDEDTMHKVRDFNGVEQILLLPPAPILSCNTDCPTGSTVPLRLRPV